MRILYHHRTQGEEPESIHIRSIVAALQELGHDVRIIGPGALGNPEGASTQGAPPSVLARIKRAVPRPVFEVLQIAYNLTAWRRLDRAVREFRPDLLYERYALFSFAGAIVAWRRRLPLILEVNTPYAQAWAHYFGLRLRRLAAWLEGRTLRSAHHIITVTHAQSALLQRLGVAPGDITVSHNAIDPRCFDVACHAQSPMRSKLGLSGVVVGFVGTMNRWQGIPQFADVVAGVLERCPETTFLFVGDGEFRQPLEDDCRERGFARQVVFCGRQPHAEIPKFVAAMDIAVLLNSNTYGSPMKIFEYWGMAKAVVAPKVPPVVEVLRDNDTGLLIEPGNAAQLADRIVDLVRDPELRRRLGAAGRAYVLEHHTWRNNAEQIIQAHAKLARAC
jgi:glycosyltransferase involved in cell wall biosynthesis